MPDCDAPTLSAPDLTSLADIPSWSVKFVAELQSAFDHVANCLRDLDYPEADICAAKDDLITCPLTPDMVDFEGVTYGDNPGIGVISEPDNVSGLQFRYGSATIWSRYNDAWGNTSITFDTPFPNECLWVGITVTKSHACETPPGEGDPGFACEGSGINVDGNDYAIIVREVTHSTTGCTVYIYREDSRCQCRVTFRYLAIGQ